MVRHWLLDRLELFHDRPALIWRGRSRSFDDLRRDSLRWLQRLKDSQIAPGTIIGIVGDYSPNVCALLIAAIINRNIVVPLTTSSTVQHDEFLHVAQAAFAIHVDENDHARTVPLKNAANHPLLRDMSARNDAGLILFSSGSTGPSKATLLDFERLLARFAQVRTATRTLIFLQLDHIGGINTLFHGLCNGGTIVTAAGRSVDTVCTTIDEHKIELLPTTPTFLRMMLIADAASRHSLKSLRTVTYGTEPMPETTLAAARSAMPWLRFKQTYGLSELGILPTQSESSGSTWLKLGNDGFETRIVNGLLWIRARSAMLGYLNAPSPFDADGWFNTQDEIVSRGDYVRILGRRSEMINVGGEKVHPSEVESVVLTMDNIRDATVFGRANPVTGQIVCARITLIGPEDIRDLKRRLRRFCASRLAPHKIPALVEIVDGDQHNYRFKKMRDFDGAALVQ